MCDLRPVVELSGPHCPHGQWGTLSAKVRILYSFGILIMKKKKGMRDNAEQGKMRPSEQCFPIVGCTNKKYY